MAMYGSIFRMRPKAGHEQAIAEMVEQWHRERRPKVEGYVATYLFRPDNRPGEAIGVAVFASREAYRKNADDPDQDRWYRQMREHLEADPQWEDGEITFSA